MPRVLYDLALELASTLSAVVPARLIDLQRDLRTTPGALAEAVESLACDYGIYVQTGPAGWLIGDMKSWRLAQRYGNGYWDRRKAMPANAPAGGES